MHTQDLSQWTHEHAFDQGNPAGERGMRLVMWITAAMMVVEIVAGWWFNSMALLADGVTVSSFSRNKNDARSASWYCRQLRQDLTRLLGGFVSRPKESGS